MLKNPFVLSFTMITFFSIDAFGKGPLEDAVLEGLNRERTIRGIKTLAPDAIDKIIWQPDAGAFCYGICEITFKNNLESPLVCKLFKKQEEFDNEVKNFTKLRAFVSANNEARQQAQSNTSSDKFPYIVEYKGYTNFTLNRNDYNSMDKSFSKLLNKASQNRFSGILLERASGTQLTQFLYNAALENDVAVQHQLASKRSESEIRTACESVGHNFAFFHLYYGGIRHESFQSRLHVAPSPNNIFINSVDAKVSFIDYNGLSDTLEKEQNISTDLSVMFNEMPHRLGVSIKEYAKNAWRTAAGYRLWNLADHYASETHNRLQYLFTLIQNAYIDVFKKRGIDLEINHKKEGEIFYSQFIQYLPQYTTKVEANHLVGAEGKPKTLRVLTDNNNQASYQLTTEQFYVVPGETIRVPYAISVGRGGIISLGLLNSSRSGWYGNQELVLEEGYHRGIFERVVPEGEREASLIFRNYHLQSAGQSIFCIDDSSIHRNILKIPFTLQKTDHATFVDIVSRKLKPNFQETKNIRNKIELENCINGVTDKNANACYQFKSNEFQVLPTQKIKVEYDINVHKGGIISLGLLNTKNNGWYDLELILKEGRQKGDFVRVVPAGETKTSLVCRNYHLQEPGQSAFTFNLSDIKISLDWSLYSSQPVNFSSTPNILEFDLVKRTKYITDYNQNASYQLESQKISVEENELIRVPYGILVENGGRLSLGFLNSQRNGWFRDELLLEGGFQEGIYECRVPSGEKATSLVLRNYHLEKPGHTSFTINYLDIEKVSLNFDYDSLSLNISGPQSVAVSLQNSKTKRYLNEQFYVPMGSGIRWQGGKLVLIQDAPFLQIADGREINILLSKSNDNIAIVKSIGVNYFGIQSDIQVTYPGQLDLIQSFAVQSPCFSNNGTLRVENLQLNVDEINNLGHIISANPIILNQHGTVINNSGLVRTPEIKGTNVNLINKEQGKTESL